MHTRTRAHKGCNKTRTNKSLRTCLLWIFFLFFFLKKCELLQEKKKRVACFVFMACPSFGELVFHFAAILSLELLLLRVMLKAALSHDPSEEILSRLEVWNRRWQVCSPSVLAGTAQSSLTSTLHPAPLLGVRRMVPQPGPCFHPPCSSLPSESKLSKAKMLKDWTKINIGITCDERSLLANPSL